MFNSFKFSSVYTKGVISLFKGNFWAQVIGLLGTFFIAKLYGPDLLGTFSKFISLSAILAIFFTLRLESAFVLSDQKKNLKDVFSSIIYTVFIGSIFCLLIVLLLPEGFYSKLNFLKIYVVFCVIGAILKSIESSYLSYLLSQEKFKVIALSRVLFTMTRYALQISLFFLMTDLGLIIGFVGATFILLLFFYRKTGGLFTMIPFSNFKNTLKENLNLVSFGVLSDNLNAINLNLIPILGGIYFSDSEIGWYFLAIVLLSVPVTFINASFSKVFFLRASQIYNKDKTLLFSFVKKYTFQLLLGLLIPFLFIFFFSKPIIHSVLKDDWLNVVAFIQLLALLFYLRSVYNPISHLEEVLKKNHIGLILNLFLLAGNLIAIYYGVIEKDFFLTIEMISYILPIGYLLMIVFFLMTTYKLRGKQS